MKAKEVIKKLEKALKIWETTSSLILVLDNVFGVNNYNYNEISEWMHVRNIFYPFASQIEQASNMKRACIENSIAHYKQLDPESEV